MMTRNPARRGIHMAAALLVALVSLVASGADVSAVPPQWTTTGPLAEARSGHTATLLSDGDVLVAGGTVASEISGRESTNSSEMYNLLNEAFRPTGSLTVARTDHSATLLSDGTVLAAGGYGESSAELYHPGLGIWIPTSPMAVPRSLHTATLLADGRVLVVGGDVLFTPTASAEIYDPRTRTWSAAGSLAIRRVNHTATLLPDGRVLVAGGESERDIRYSATYNLDSVEIYDPAEVDPLTGLQGRWQLGPPLLHARSQHTATTFGNGSVLVVGGDGALTSAEVYDHSTKSWSATGPLATARRLHTATLLGHQRVLVVGGNAAHGSAEIYDFGEGVWSSTVSLSEDRLRHTATRLADDSVLVAGGDVASSERFGRRRSTR